MAEGPLRLSWRVLDGLDYLDYLWTLTTLRILDGLVGPPAGNAGDQQRKRDRSGWKGRSLVSSQEEPGAAITRGADRLQ